MHEQNKQGLLAAMAKDGVTTFAGKVAWVKKHVKDIDDAEAFVGALVKDEDDAQKAWDGVDGYFAYDARCALEFDLEPTMAKAGDDKEPQATARFVALVSASGKDFQGEDLDQDGLDWDYFFKHGWFNWEHQPGPENILGYPEPDSLSRTKTADGVPATRLVGHLLLSKPRAKEVYETALALQKSNSGRQIGFSVEGGVTKRDPRNPKHVLRAMVRNVAITAHPIQPSARLELVKSLDALAVLAKSGDGVGSLGQQTAPGMAGGDADLSPLLRQSIDRKPARGTTYRDDELEKLILQKFPAFRKSQGLRKAVAALRKHLELSEP